MTGSVTVVWALARKDLLLEFRNRDVVVAIAAFSALVLAIFTFAVDLSDQNARVIGPGVLWAGIAFAGVLGLNRAVATEVEQGGMDALMLTPVSRDLVFMGKALGNFIFLALAQLAVLPLFAVLFNLVVFRWEMLVICILATTGFSSVGTLFAATSVKTRAREIMLPMLFLPVTAPLLIAAVEATASVAIEESWSDMAQWLQLAAAFDVVFVVVAALAFQYVLEE